MLQLRVEQLLDLEWLFILMKSFYFQQKWLTEVCKSQQNNIQKAAVTAGKKAKEEEEDYKTKAHIEPATTTCYMKMIKPASTTCYIKSM